ncbi:unnamed protein product, partial [Effrenium voratum]
MVPVASSWLKMHLGLAIAPRVSRPLSTSSAPSPAAAAAVAPRLAATASGTAALAAGAGAARGARGRRTKTARRAVMGAIFGREDYFEEKTVWITGASGGFGEALAVALCSHKVQGLVLSARRKEALERVKERCREISPTVSVEVLPLDLSDLGSLPEAAKAAKAFFG